MVYEERLQKRLRRPEEGEGKGARRHKKTIREKPKLAFASRWDAQTNCVGIQMDKGTGGEEGLGIIIKEKTSSLCVGVFASGNGFQDAACWRVQ